MALTLSATLLVAFASRVAYDHNEQRLTRLQTQLTGLLLEAAPAQIQGQLNRVVGLSAESSDPPATFDAAMAPLMKPRGQYSSAALVLMSPSPKVLVHLGSAPIRNPAGAAASGLYERAARSTSLVTTRAVSGRIQRLGFLVSARGSAGIYVIGASLQLPTSRRVTLPAGSPEAILNFALYYGTRPNSTSLIETNSANLPIRGTVSTIAVPFGTTHLTLVAGPRSSLAGAWSEYLPWGIVGLGIILAGAVGLLAEWLGRRRTDAESIAHATQDLYDEQREVSKILQLALLPKTLPTLRDVEVSASYIPTAKSAEVGGDWYSVLEIDEDHFAFVVGDVSGHGISAISSMAPLRFSIRTLAFLGMTPSEILHRVDREIDLGRDQHFATVLIGIVDTPQRTLTLASAGHLLPFVLIDGHCDQLGMPVGPPLGLHGLSEPQFPERSFGLPPGATLIAFTDGLIEQRGQPMEMGLDQLKKRLTSQPDETAQLTLQRAIAEVTGHDNEDDIALLVIRMPTEPLDLVQRPGERFEASSTG